MNTKIELFEKYLLISKQIFAGVEEAITSVVTGSELAETAQLLS